MSDHDAASLFKKFYDSEWVSFTGTPCIYKYIR